MNVLSLHEPLWSRLQGRRARLPHALMLAGPRGVGKLEIARAFAATLLCESPRGDGHACCTCLACGWFAQGNHPDFRLLQPESLASGELDDGKAEKKKASEQITIDQVRDLDDFLSVGAHRGGLRLVLVHPAEAMNRNTANALLKSLEEPGPQTLFLLVTHEPMRLLPTLRSRCQIEAVPVPGRRLSLAALAAAGIKEPERWLALAGGAPLLAEELASSGEGDWLGRLAQRLQSTDGDAFSVAAEVDRWIKEGKGQVGLRGIVDAFQKWVVDLTLVATGMPVRYFVAHQATIAAIVCQLSVPSLIGFYRRLCEARRQVEQPVNGRLFLENLFLDYRGLFASSQRR